MIVVGISIRLLARALLLAGVLLVGCGQGDGPLELEVDAVEEVFVGEGSTDGLLAVTVTLENRGPRAVHVFYNGIRLVPEGADPTGYGEFIRDLGPLVAQDPVPAEHAELRVTLDALGFDRAWARATVRNERAIEPGESVRERFGFRVDGPTGWGTLELRYHDDATDRFERMQRPVRVVSDSR
ncbi:hypothetical protein TVNIR_2754 [Thioalkalivibrio nitratireducens DSM 14787]|uniref:Uncharacterized protein n=1 Tax=Thioalkalivibrio nitratireducens (strain DSM 14787 / UNIQEM 213 / ALEN2) TaxID=1255043 RepID=L0DZI0_THIND|nr:hypothetical protein [Thioalkalivibrio nitratireducens]AGA34392.1 hypothetical protein TVNIR_2754 [Thioalkalivibrio nitratireducens DSM 14787]